ncbi:EF-P lysine aminoacylase EpmA [Polycyclovorans algicola]|uniref:EF-P lysine aminoacylase EpmA n=1 Tax=Polycyclovorans algicola TaxID=616992 RepID=UPI0004A73992|nr:EF-P lysine aminoacylase EpmA [Polycyclovorans algicola]
MRVPREAWAPSAPRTHLKARADLYRSIRAFFDARGVLEVDTPILSRHATVDRHIDSFLAAPDLASHTAQRYLQTSPEFAMKRLLCAGSGAIWQMAKAFRAEEAGRVHNPEFTLLEWYRPGFDHHQLMNEVEALLRAVGVTAAPAFDRLTYRDAFQRHAGIDPHTASLATLKALPETHAFADEMDRDVLLDLWMSHRVGPNLGREVPCFVHDFPASQAALSRVANDRAQRFELFWDGLELANGFFELADADEQHQRFIAEQRWRAERGRAAPPLDAHLIAALRHGLPDCAGVALGVDRLLMRLLGVASIDEVLAFPAGQA